MENLALAFDQSPKLMATYAAIGAGYLGFWALSVREHRAKRGKVRIGH